MREMKIEASVIGIESHGDTIQVTLQGKEPGSAQWRPWARQVFKVAENERNAKAFYIGRKVEIEIKPK
jgi:hypothetical protein